MDRREAIEWLEQIKDIYIRGGDEDFDRRRKEALDLAIEALKGDLHCPKCGTIVRDGRQYHDLVYRGEAEQIKGDAESATTTDCNDCIWNTCNYNKIDWEVSEDCISKHDLWRIIEDNAYWITYNETSKEKGMTLTGINQALNECPPVTPPKKVVAQISIDTEELIERIKEEYEITNKVGEWIKHDPKTKGLAKIYECPFCGDEVIGEKTNFCPNCGAKMGGDTE